MWIKGLVGQGFGGSGGSERVMGECLVGQWIVGVISFQKIFGLYGLERHIVEKRWGVTLVHGRRTECEDRARILKQNSQLLSVRKLIQVQMLYPGSVVPLAMFWLLVRRFVFLGCGAGQKIACLSLLSYAHSSQFILSRFSGRALQAFF